MLGFFSVFKCNFKFLNFFLHPPVLSVGSKDESLAVLSLLLPIMCKMDKILLSLFSKQNSPSPYFDGPTLNLFLQVCLSLLRGVQHNTWDVPQQHWTEGKTTSPDPRTVVLVMSPETSLITLFLPLFFACLSELLDPDAAVKSCFPPSHSPARTGATPCKGQFCISSAELQLIPHHFTSATSYFNLLVLSLFVNFPRVHSVPSLQSITMLAVWAQGYNLGNTCLQLHFMSLTTKPLQPNF